MIWTETVPALALRRLSKSANDKRLLPFLAKVDIEHVSIDCHASGVAIYNACERVIVEVLFVSAFPSQCLQETW